MKALIFSLTMLVLLALLVGPAAARPRAPHLRPTSTVTATWKPSFSGSLHSGRCRSSEPATSTTTTIRT